MVFQSTPPVKAATTLKSIKAVIAMISIHAAREGGDYGEKALDASCKISIHAAREGGDCGDTHDKHQR